MSYYENILPSSLGDAPVPNPALDAALVVVDTASMALSAYHGLKRHNGSVGWAILWGVMGSMFPVITPAIAFFKDFSNTGQSSEA